MTSPGQSGAAQPRSAALGKRSCPTFIALKGQNNLGDEQANALLRRQYRERHWAVPAVPRA